MKGPQGHQEIMGKVAKFCSQRERSPEEVTLKLTKWGYENDRIEEIVSYLIDQGFLNSRRFAAAYCHDKFEFNSWGKHKIRAHIFNHKIDNKDLEFGLSQIDEVAYKARIKKLALKKWGQLKEGDSLKKPKTVKYLLSKGFEYDLVMEAMEQIR